MASTILSGAVFGAALTSSGLYQPAAIVAQLKLQSWHMMETFLTATASSTLIISILQKTGLASVPPRPYSSVGLFASFDGNVIGGVLLGVGMAISGSCPGTVLAQVGAGLRSGCLSLAGAILGGVVWSGVSHRLLRQPAAPGEAEQEKLTVHGSLGMNKVVAVAAFEVVLIATVAALVVLTPPSPWARIPPVVGGLLIGSAQLFSVLVREEPLGVSTGYEEIGDWLGWAIKSAAGSRRWGGDGSPGENDRLIRRTGADEGETARDAASSSVPQKTEANSRPTYEHILFGVGIVAGAWALGSAFPTLLDVPGLVISSYLSVTGGFLIVFGGRMAGGCPSGHGISGMSLLSVSSFITIASALGSAILTAILFL